MKKTIIALLILLTGWHTAQAQDISQFNTLNDSAYQTKAEYQSANKYQKDAILFMDMVADTHPYYVKPERREEWFAKKDVLLEKCQTMETDEALADALNEVLGKLKDKHTSVTTQKQLEELKAEFRKEQKEKGIVAGAPDREHIMRPHNNIYDYQIFSNQSICYLQFNKCASKADYPFDEFLNNMFDQIEKDDINTLLVDVQYNGGGNSYYCSQLFERLYPVDKTNFFSTYIRLSNYLASINPDYASLKDSWEKEGHKDELYKYPARKIPANYPQPKLFEGNVVFVMGPQTYSSAGILLTFARDHHLGTIIGTTSTFSPSHYGDVLCFRLPNTGVGGSIPHKFFVRPDKSKSDETVMQPDVEIDLGDKDAAWQYILQQYGKAKAQCRYYKSYEDFIEDRWVPLGDIFVSSHNEKYKFWWGGDDYSIATGDSEKDLILRNEAFIIMQGDMLYLNCNKLKNSDLRFSLGYVKAKYLEGRGLVFVGPGAVKIDKTENDRSNAYAAAGTAIGLASLAITGVGFVVVPTGNVSGKNKGPVCYLISDTSTNAEGYRIRQINDRVMSIIMINNDKLCKEYYAEKNEGRRQLAKHIIPILEKSGHLFSAPRRSEETDTPAE